MRQRTILGLLMSASAATATGQTETPTGATVPAARAADVATAEAIVTALYQVISGPAGQARDWDRFRSLFVPEARLIPTFVPQGESAVRDRYLSVEDYIRTSGPLLVERGFFERQVASVAERFESIAHVFSTYESRTTPDGEVFQRGINSIQLIWDGRRWWVANILWRGVGPGVEIPARYRGP
jgi:hypothetical protein